MNEQVTTLAAQCGALFHRNGVSFDEPAWRKFVEVLRVMLPINGSQHERVSHDGVGVDFYYEKTPTAATYAYLAAFCKFQESQAPASPLPASTNPNLEVK